MVTIAYKYNFFGVWQTIYEHEANEELRKKRPNPMCLMPGDKVYIPPIKATKWWPLKVGKVNKFVIKRVRVYFSMILPLEEFPRH